ncbi:protein timeless isoform X2 [Adelges cooleyi]|uniref:protein timeless isoform X2 n=1 Tax=Adelges cooleyi TaxID=133065 RepID=UPI0021803814|nr:protein timeless isoform X2 [Adelges cooleyi]
MDMPSYLPNAQVQTMFAQLGMVIGNEYVLSKNCYAILLQIHTQLDTEDPNQRNFRKIIGFLQLIQKDLIPILINVDNDEILELLVKLLANIMMPIEFLVPTHQMISDEAGQATIIKLGWLLTSGKNAFVNKKAIKRVTQLICEKSAKVTDSLTYSCHFEVINDCLCLLKNVLHVPNNQSQNQILWMLFSEKIDEILINLIANVNRGQWAMLIIELIALIWKNQHVDQMARKLSTWNKTMISDSSEDNESNTSSSPRINNGENSIAQNTSTESSTSDEYDSDRPAVVKKGDDEPMDIQVGDHVMPRPLFKAPGSVAIVISKGNDTTKKNIKLVPDVNKKCSTARIAMTKSGQDCKMSGLSISKKTKMRVKKVMKKSKLNMRISTAVHTPTGDQITHLLQKFTVNFMRNGFNSLVYEVYKQLTLPNAHKKVDTSLYFWMLTYFCRFCKILDVDLKTVRNIVSFRLISFMAHEGLNVLEQLLVAKRQKAHDLHLHVRHLHLVVMAIKEVIKTIEYYRQSTVGSPVYGEFIEELKNSGCNSPDSITWTQDLKSLFALLIRHYDQKIQVNEYLQDLITTNHLVLIFFDNFKDFWNLNECIRAHVKKFAAPDIMLNYGLVLKNHETNKEFVNEAVLTMMHHIVGEVENTTVLYQPIIMKSFLEILEKKEDLYDRWSDLVEYVIHKFLNLSQSCVPLLTLDKSLNSLEHNEYFKAIKLRRT